MEFQPTLIVDPDPDFLRSLENHERAKVVKPFTASTLADAEKFLRVKNASFSGLFVNPEAAKPGGASILRIAHEMHPGMPIFYVVDQQDMALTEDLLRGLAIQKIIQKPVGYAELLGLLIPEEMEQTLRETLDRTGVNAQADNPETVQLPRDSDYIPIRATTFLSGSKSFFDVYVSLSSGRFLKILNAGDQFTLDRLAAYLKKGVRFFYLRKEAQRKYLEYCGKLAAALLKSPDAPATIKTSMTMAHGEETLSLLKHLGVSDGNLDYARQFVQNVDTLIDQLDLDKHESISKFLQDIAAFKHGAATTVMASMLIKPMGFTSPQIIETVGLAALLHDIALSLQYPHLIHEDEASMSEVEVAQYRTHPITGSKVLEQVRRLNPIIPQAVAQHHERRDRSGFPARARGGEIVPVAEVIGICDEFIRIVAAAREDPSVRPLEVMDAKVFNGFSYSVVNAFNEALHLSRRSKSWTPPLA